jgi:hypothetical protein
LVTAVAFPRPPRFHAEAPRGFALDIPSKSGDPHAFNFNQPDVNSPSADEFITDVPRSVTRHSPDGFAWGYAGSGAQDLALNILHYVYPPGSDGHEPILVGDKHVSWTTERLYGDYTREIVSQIPREQPFQIRCEEVRQWVAEKSKSLEADPQLPDFFPNRTITPFERKLYVVPYTSLRSLPATRTDQRGQDHQGGWEQEHSELGALNARIKNAIAEHVIDVAKSSRAVEGGKEAQQKHFYSELVELGRLIHAIDVELLRSEAREERPNLHGILSNLPQGLRPLLEEFGALFDRESVRVRRWFESVGVEQVAREVLHRRVTDGLSVFPYGPWLVVGCGTKASWDSVNTRLRGDAGDSCGGFATCVSISGTPSMIMAVPTFQDSIYDLDSQHWMREVFVHEREHLAQRFRACWRTDSSFFDAPQSEQSVRRECFQGYVEAFREEALAYFLSGDWSDESKRALIKRGPRALYDFPRAFRESWMVALEKMLPGHSETERAELLDSVAQEYRVWRTKFMSLTSALGGSQHNGAHEVIRALDLLAVETWPRHLERMSQLGFFDSHVASGKRR